VKTGTISIVVPVFSYGQRKLTRHDGIPRRTIQTIAGNPNVYCKASGVVTEVVWCNWRDLDFRPYLDVVFEAFGPDRIVFGSDSPVCLLAKCPQPSFLAFFASGALLSLLVVLLVSRRAPVWAIVLVGFF
jgi:Amidohydrolase